MQMYDAVTEKFCSVSSGYDFESGVNKVIQIEAFKGESFLAWNGMRLCVWYDGGARNAGDSGAAGNCRDEPR